MKRGFALFAVAGTLASTFGVQRGAGAAIGDCFTPGTEVHTPQGLVSIEKVELGARVLTSYGTSIERTAVDESWRRIDLEMEDPRNTNGKLRVALLRPRGWLEDVRARVGSVIPFELTEMGLRGRARVISVRGAPRIRSGAGRVVLSTIASRSTNVLVLKFHGTYETLEPTFGHKLYSIDRNDWARAGELRIGERLRAANGDVTIASIERKPGTHDVYNFEVESEHEYLVSSLGIRSHNHNCE